MYLLQMFYREYVLLVWVVYSYINSVIPVHSCLTVLWIRGTYVFTVMFDISGVDHKIHLVLQ